MGAIGGGDVKLITALGAMMGLPVWTEAMKVTVFAAAALALITIVRHGALRDTVHNILEITRGWFTRGLRQHPSLNVRNAAALRSPFGVAAAIGTIVTVIR